ncbi:hypothetical protein CC86DRAFT_415772 [Ophiobolus disseminans]|uniref:Tautomerase cis-CaaD-like domain-containing protein n=1 Tax=Ophiobolus disseminans TaxID=1469910 RepID=A0A6A7AKK5_9PLEO|nr:hypothetical protein CC86DRAFT_415772 [Ophiobolus disseminans]
MPLWIVYHPPSTFTTPEIKKEFAQAITAIYNTILPAFYVNVLFQPIEPSSFLIGAVARPSPHVAANEPGQKSDVPFIRLTIEHIARSLPTPEIRDSFLKKIDAAMKPFIADMGYDWEYSIDETSRDLWKVNGMVPPKQDTKAEKEWRETNVPAPFKKADGGLEGEGMEGSKL